MSRSWSSERTIDTTQAYLPEAFQEQDASSVSLFLLVHRIASKSGMLINIVNQLLNLPSALHIGASAHLANACELRGKLRCLSSLCKRFGAAMSRSTAEEWLKCGKVWSDINAMEGQVDRWVDALKADNLNEADCAREVNGLTMQLNRSIEALFGPPRSDLPEFQLGSAYVIDEDLDTSTICLAFVRQAISNLVKDENVSVDDGGSTLETRISEPVQHILDIGRSIKISASKIIALLEELVQSATAFQPEVASHLSDLVFSVSKAVAISKTLSQRVGSHVDALSHAKQNLRLDDVQRIIEDVTGSLSDFTEGSPWDRIKKLHEGVLEQTEMILPKMQLARKMGHLIGVKSPPPWFARAALIRETAAQASANDATLRRLSHELKDSILEIKVRDQSLQESTVKVETLERRLEESRKQAGVIIELGTEIVKVKQQEKVYTEAIGLLQREQETLEAENAKLRKGQGAGGRQGLPFLNGDGFGGAASLDDPYVRDQVELNLLQQQDRLTDSPSQVENLRSAVRFLRQENAMLKSKELYDDLHFLPALSRRLEDPAPELDPSSPIASPSSSSISEDPETPTRQSLETESKLLFRDIAAFHASPRIVDISSLSSATGWRSRKQSPEQQIWAWSVEEKKLGKRIEKLAEKTTPLGRKRRL